MFNSEKKPIFSSEKKPIRSQAVLSQMSLTNYNTKEMSFLGKNWTDDDHYDPYRTAAPKIQHKIFRGPKSRTRRTVPHDSLKSRTISIASSTI